MGTGTCKRRTGGVGFFALVSASAILAACGGGSSGTHGSGGSGAPNRRGATPRGAFAWLRPEPPPSDWTVVRTPSGVALAYPPNWRAQHSDSGTATAALLRPDGAYLGYLNLTPRQGEETLSNWSSFRVDHNREEGDRSVRRLAAATGLRFIGGSGSCVKDAYTTVTNARFVEIACLVAGARAESVIVAAAPPREWSRMSATLERAIAGVQR